MALIVIDEYYVEKIMEQSIDNGENVMMLKPEVEVKSVEQPIDALTFFVRPIRKLEEHF
jgi:hypothetical protein